MKTVEQLRQDRNDLAAKMKTIVDAMEAGQLSNEQAAAFDAAEKEFNTIDANVKRMEKMADVHDRLAQPRPTVAERQIAERIVRGPESKKEFESLDEFMVACISTLTGRNSDPRLDWHDKDLRGTDQSMGTGSTGGFAVPTQFRPELLSVNQAAGIVRQRARIIPAGSPPDSAVSMPALDQGTSQNMYGGVEVAWVAEAGAKPAANFALREITLTPNEVAAYIPFTDKLMRNWQAAGAIASELLRKAIGAAEDSAFISGSGVGKPYGFLGCSAALTVNRAGAGTVGYADICGMEAKMLSGAQPVWFTTRKVVSKLRQMVDGGSHLIWNNGNVVDGTPPTLNGYPVFVHPRMPQLGVKGDLVLVDLSHYLIKDGSGPFIASSEHVYFLNNKTVIKAFWNVDGQPWLKDPITNENGDVESPFVILDLVSA